jgi:energy-coupling factor transporter ATP-binding protein EcfA2
MAPLNITRGRIIQALKVILYGPEGIGKTTLAACFPGVVFIDTEGSTKSFDVARLPAPTSWEMLVAEVQEVLNHADEVGTLCIDTADWAEKLCSQAVCQKGGKTGIEDYGYGKGYVYMAEEFGRLLDACSQLTDRGVNVVFTAHCQQRKVELPDQMDTYDKYELKCSKQISPLLKEWADMVLFAGSPFEVMSSPELVVCGGKIVK